MSASDLEVWLDSDLDEMRRVGTLCHDRGQVRFSDDKAWIKDAKAFMLDPDCWRRPITEPGSELDRRRQFSRFAGLQSGVAGVPAGLSVPMMSDGRRLLSVFCGAGGLDLGFEQAGFDVQLAFDIRPDAVLSHNKNRADKPAAAHRIDVRDITLAKLDELVGGTFKPMGVVGGPPCQSFSQANRSPLDEDDPRHKLPFVYGDLIQKLNARSPLHFFVLENVVALRESPHVERFEEIKKKLDKAGFRVHEAVLDASSYGVPQRRERLILVGLNKKLYPDLVWEAPKKVEVPAEHLTVRHAFKELPEPVHYRRGLKRTDLVFHPNHWCMAPKSKKFTTPGALVEGRRGNRSFKTLSWNLPSVTVAYGNREVHVHPDCKRRLSVLEAMRLQGFPDRYVLEGSLSSQITQVSEAVPPPMAKAVALTLKQILDRALLSKPAGKAKTVAKIKKAQPKKTVSLSDSQRRC